MKRNHKIDKNALVADKTEVFNLRVSQTKSFSHNRHRFLFGKFKPADKKLIYFEFFIWTPWTTRTPWNTSWKRMIEREILACQWEFEIYLYGTN